MLLPLPASPRPAQCRCSYRRRLQGGGAQVQVLYCPPILTSTYESFVSVFFLLTELFVQDSSVNLSAGALLIVCHNLICSTIFFRKAPSPTWFCHRLMSMPTATTSLAKECLKFMKMAGFSLRHRSEQFFLITNTRQQVTRDR